MYGRHLGWRGDTISYMKLRDVEFSTVVTDEGDKILVAKNTGLKNKGIGRDELRNTVYGSSNWND